MQRPLIIPWGVVRPFCLAALAGLAALPPPARAEPNAPAVLLAAGLGNAPEQAAPDGDDPINLTPPQKTPLQYPVPPADPSQVAPPTPLAPRSSLPVPDRWRIMEALGLKQDPIDPYDQNELKGDKPFRPFAPLGPDWFFNLGVVSDTVYESSRIPIPTGGAGADRSNSLDTFGRPDLSLFSQTVLITTSVIEGDTTFKPPDYEMRLTTALNSTYATADERGVLNVNPESGLSRADHFVGIQELFIDKHLRNVSANYDFDSLRIGIQPFTSDFRGFVFQDNAFGVRLFGTRDSNQWQYNLAWLRRIEKDTNSGLNDLGAGLRRDDTYIFNLYHQDFPVEGHTTQFTALYNENHEDDAQFYDSNGFLERPAPVGDGLPHHYGVLYLGLNGDGHFGRWNLTSSLYAALGHDSHNPIAEQPQTITAGFAALELSRDFDWVRVRGTLVGATGDSDPYDKRATGFDAIQENPLIAGADTSFFIRQAIPLIGGGGVILSGRNALLPSLRTSEDQGQSNFVNPGLLLEGLGADFDLSPQVRLLTNVSHLSFANTAVLEVLRQQGHIDRDIGMDLSTGVQVRPFDTQNIVFNGSVAVLVPGRGFHQLYDVDRIGTPYSILFNLLLRY